LSILRLAGSLSQGLPGAPHDRRLRVIPTDGIVQERLPLPWRSADLSDVSRRPALRPNPGGVGERV